MNIHASDAIDEDVEQTQEAKSRAIESVARTFETLKRLIADYDELKDERDKFENQVVSLVNENDALREQVKRIDQERNRCVQALLACASQIDVIGGRCAEVVKNVKTQASSSDSAMAALRKGNLQDRPGQRSELDTPKFSKESPDDFRWGAARPRTASEAGNSYSEPRKRTVEEPELKKSSPDTSDDEKNRPSGSGMDRLSKILSQDPYRRD
jgi:hypothetical protein